jgi:hypothetical protein
MANMPSEMLGSLGERHATGVVNSLWRIATSVIMRTFPTSDVCVRLWFLQEQLEELWQELEQLRVKNDALKADNATLLAERADDGAAAAHSNGDLKPRAAGDGADAPAAAAAAELEAARQRIAELEVRLAHHNLFLTGLDIPLFMKHCSRSNDDVTFYAFQSSDYIACCCGRCDIFFHLLTYIRLSMQCSFCNNQRHPCAVSAVNSNKF